MLDDIAIIDGLIQRVTNDNGPDRLAWTRIKTALGELATSHNTPKQSAAQICQSVTKEIIGYLKHHGYHSHKGMCAGTLDSAIKNIVAGKLQLG